MESQTATPAATETIQDEKGSVLYNAKTVSLVASLSNIFSWVILVAFAGQVVASFLNVQKMIAQQGMAFSELFKDSSAISYLMTNLSAPLFTGVALFFVLQGVALGLNVLMEIDLKTGDSE